MFPWPLGLTTLIQGLYSLLWILVLMDVASPTLDLRQLPPLSALPLALLVAAFSTLTFAVGVVMHTLSRNLFRRKKDAWVCQVLTSENVTQRLGTLGPRSPGDAPTIDEILAAEGREQVHKASEYMSAIDYVITMRSPSIRRSIEVYRDQYRLARGFILPSLLLALILPFWEPVPFGDLGRFPLISFQLFFLAVLFAGVSMYAFRERAFRYSAARVRSFITLESEQQKASQEARRPLSAVG